MDPVLSWCKLMTSEWVSFEQSPLVARQRLRERDQARGAASIDDEPLPAVRQSGKPGLQSEGPSASVKNLQTFFSAFVNLFAWIFELFPKMKKEDAQISDTDSSLIILDVVEDKVPAFGTEDVEDAAKNDDGFLHQSWIDTTEVPQETSQYGTSFSDAKTSRFTEARARDRRYNQIFTQSALKSSRNIHEFTPKLSRTAYDDFVSKYYLPQAPSKSQYSLVDTLVDTYLADEVSKIDTERENRRHKIASEREALTSRIEPLQKDQLASVLKYWQAPNSTIVKSQFQIDITARDLSTLSDGQWLNDNVIDFYFNLFTNSNVFGWTTHFYTTLKERGYAGVARWAKRKKVDVTSKDLILVPINIMGTHWALAVVDNRNKQFQYFDSLSSHGNPQALQLLRQYMSAEAEKQKSPIDYSTFKISPSEKAPQQSNGYDCGVFMCTCAKFLAKGYRLTYGQRDMKVIRRRMAYEIIQGKLLA
ncbi:Ubiquitin-like-specific protease 1 [Meyerozyma sp. JA9]|nr:Ubiquitin-like-specific protease 1 [Meyerozyma sp. JA9]